MYVHLRPRCLSMLSLLVLVTACGGGGELDPDFGAGGVLEWGVPGVRNVPEASVLLADGRSAVVGFSDDHGVVLSVEPDGTLSTGFGAGGVVELDVADSSALRSVVALDDVGMVVAGEVRVLGGDLDFLLMGFRQDGTPDPNFNDGFPVVIDFDGGEDACQGLARMPDGGYIAVGTSDGDIAAARLTADGAAEFAFGIGGRATWNFGDDSRGRAVAVQSDGGIVITGSIARGGVAHDSVFVMRASPGGVLDSTFAAVGLWEAVRDGEDTAQSVLVDAEANIVFAGVTAGDLLVGRLLPDGSPDPAFGDGGLLVQDFGVFETGTDVALQPDGRLVVVAGYAALPPSDLLVMRLLPNGQPDAAFAGNGNEVRDLCPFDLPVSVVLQPDGHAQITSLCAPEPIFATSTIQVVRVGMD